MFSSCENIFFVFIEQNIPANPVENVDHIFKFPMRNNVTYNLWDLGGFKVIVRCNIHGVMRDLNQQVL